MHQTPTNSASDLSKQKVPVEKKTTQNERPLETNPTRGGGKKERQREISRFQTGQWSQQQTGGGWKCLGLAAAKIESILAHQNIGNRELFQMMAPMDCGNTHTRSSILPLSLSGEIRRLIKASNYSRNAERRCSRGSWENGKNIPIFSFIIYLVYGYPCV
ncbi:hypothetical protein TNIN_227861 [Trichonephila inaurata madagascariensis]|uniref:Uncharacterized protein n=1 Tax=Trichonephila inaurata madagascariensis TaxID=2747483 RepID=A0A8X7BYF9_9ARAC|nr:hypothetical protein TNIN_227861 [Trichonephila inaurata madagascariensis]